MVGVLVMLGIFLGICAAREAPTQTVPLIAKYLSGDPILDAKHMPVPQNTATLQALARTLNSTPDGDSLWGVGDPQTIIAAVYKATKIPGIFEHVPEPLRGVFWMKGNGVPEELVSIQYGRWFEEEKTYVMVWTKMGWTWTSERPDEAPFNGAMYTPELAAAAAGTLVQGQISLSWQFNQNLTYAWMQSHGSGDLRQHQNLGFFGISADFEMTDISLPGQLPGTLWRRGIRWGVGACKWIEFGSYQLTKILSGDGTPVEPYHTEFLKYMGNKSMFLWLGKINETTAEMVSVNTTTSSRNTTSTANLTATTNLTAVGIAA